MGEPPTKYMQTYQKLSFFDFEWNYKLDSELYWPYVADFLGGVESWFLDTKVKFEDKSHLSIFVHVRSGFSSL